MGLSFAACDRLATQWLMGDSPADVLGMTAIAVLAPAPHALTLDILRRQRDFFIARPPETPFLVCDPDLLFFKPISDLFEDDFDIAFTRRSGSRRMPFNSGIFFVNNRKPEAAARFWSMQVDAIEQAFMADAGWYADQLVLRHLIEEKAVALGSDRYRLDGLTIRIIDGETYNFSPRREHPYLLRRPDVHVYHFKGRCRSYMAAFYRHFIAPVKPPMEPMMRLLAALRLDRERGRLKPLYVRARERCAPVGVEAMPEPRRAALVEACEPSLNPVVPGAPSS
ncbi:hypothetical protein [Rhizobium sp. RU20A]|uniref:hypothetical protein n=1 Tax=Rhizobium sp. RU20A TaxID=1907412 RepID=UPI00122CDBD7|nr:hypothetical protein [Rhizobium sp. RU20A]